MYTAIANKVGILFTTIMVLSGTCIVKLFCACIGRIQSAGTLVVVLVNVSCLVD